MTAVSEQPTQQSTFTKTEVPPGDSQGASSTGPAFAVTEVTSNAGQDTPSSGRYLSEYVSSAASAVSSIRDKMMKFVSRSDAGTASPYDQDPNTRGLADAFSE
jgi:hypothetical protein